LAVAFSHTIRRKIQKELEENVSSFLQEHVDELLDDFSMP
jgi:hypothetical protein